MNEDPKPEDSHTAQALLDAMHTYSDELCAGWLNDMEFYLWSAVVRDGKYKRSLDPSFVSLLRMLASESGGWWVHCLTVDADWQASGGRVFLPTEQWTTIYAAKGPLE